MDLVPIFRRVGWIFFGLMWIPFIGIFIGMIGMPEGSYDFAELPAITRYSLIAVGFFFAGTFLFLFGGMFFGMFRSNVVLKTGKDAVAEIISTWDTGTTINENPVVGFELHVTPDDFPEFTARTEKLISRLRIMDYQVGKAVNVKYDPETEEVAIV